MAEQAIPEGSELWTEIIKGHDSELRGDLDDAMQNATDMDQAVHLALAPMVKSMSKRVYFPENAVSLGASIQTVIQIATAAATKAVNPQPFSRIAIQEVLRDMLSNALTAELARLAFDHGNAETVKQKRQERMQQFLSTHARSKSIGVLEETENRTQPEGES